MSSALVLMQSFSKSAPR